MDTEHELHEMRAEVDLSLPHEVPFIEPNPVGEATDKIARMIHPRKRLGSPNVI